MTDTYKNIKRPRRGFTLIELLISIGLIAILASIIIVAINPQRQIRDARNAQRHSDINTILNGIYQYMLDNEGDPPSTISATPMEICKVGTTCNNGVDLKMLTGAYLAGIPVDPTAGVTGTGTDYWVYLDTDGRITMTAPNAENNMTISR